MGGGGGGEIQNTGGREGGAGRGGKQMIDYLEVGICLGSQVAEIPNTVGTIRHEAECDDLE